MEGLDGFKLAWRFAEGETITNMSRELKVSYGYLKFLIGQHLLPEQIRNIIYFQKRTDLAGIIKKKVKKTTFLDNWKQSHRPHNGV
jgi:hypothetical protein